MTPADLDVEKPPAEDVFGVPFWTGDADGAAAWLSQRLRLPKPFTIAFANPEFMLTCDRHPALRDYLLKCEAVFADGVGILWASRLKQGQIRQRITGTDFQWRVFDLAAQLGLRVFLYGGQPGIADEAMQRIRARLPQLQAIDCCDGYMDRTQALERIRAFAPDVLMVCLGNPLQEAWIERHSADTGARLVFGNGGAIDFIAGRARRAPTWMCAHGLEWAWRLGQDFSPARIRRQARLARYLWRLVRMSATRR